MSLEDFDTRNHRVQVTAGKGKHKYTIRKTLNPNAYNQYQGMLQHPEAYTKNDLAHFLRYNNTMTNYRNVISWVKYGLPEAIRFSLQDGEGMAMQLSRITENMSDRQIFELGKRIIKEGKVETTFVMSKETEPLEDADRVDIAQTILNIATDFSMEALYGSLYSGLWMKMKKNDPHNVYNFEEMAERKGIHDYIKSEYGSVENYYKEVGLEEMNKMYKDLQKEHPNAYIIPPYMVKMEELKGKAKPYIDAYLNGSKKLRFTKREKDAIDLELKYMKR